MNSLHIEIVILVLFVATIVVGWGAGIYLIRKVDVYEAFKRITHNINTNQKILEGVVKTPIKYQDKPLALDEYTQRVVNAALQQPPRGIDEMVTANGWTYIRCSNSLGPFVSIYIYDLEEYSPHILMRRSDYGGTVLRFFVQLVEAQSLVLCEGIVDSDYDIFTETGDELDVLTILSPDALEPLHNAPFESTVMIKHDKLYYMMYGHKTVEDTFVAIDRHAMRAIPALEDNLRRWGRGQANREKLKRLLSNPIGTSDAEYFEHPDGKIFTDF